MISTTGDGDSLFKYSNNRSSQIQTEIFNCLKLNTCCDFSIETEDDGKIPVHKLILISANPFYKILFEAGLSDSKNKSHLLTGISKECAEKLIDFIYTGDIELSSKDAWEILDKAVYLSIPDLAKFCCEVLIKSINVENCLELWLYATSFRNLIEESLQLNCAKYIFENIDDILNKEQLKNLTTDDIEELLSYGRKNGFDEKCLSLVIKWILSNFINREQHIHRLIDKVRIEKISLEFFTENILKNETLTASRSFLEVIYDILKRYTKNQLKEGHGKENIAPELPKVFVIINGEIIQYDSRDRNFFTTEYSRLVNWNALFSAVTTYGNCENNIFICGGLKYVAGAKVYLNDCKYLSEKQNMWNNLPSMEYKRSGHRSINFNDKIYVCGGYSHGSGVLSSEYFDLNAKKWVEVPAMNYNMYKFGLAIAKNCLYAINSTNEIEFFDTRENTWTKNEVYNSSVCGTKILRSLIFDDNILYCFGNENVFKFDIRNNKWIDDETHNYDCGFTDEYNTLATSFYEDEEILCIKSNTKKKSSNYLVQRLKKSNLKQISCDKFSFGRNKIVDEIICL